MHSLWIVFGAAFTPIPCKVFAITAGVMSVSFPGFVIASAIGCSLRFFIIAALMYCFGEKTKQFIKKYFEWLTIVFTALLISSFVFIKKFISWTPTA